MRSTQRSHAVSWNTRLIRRSKPRIRFLRATPPPPAPADFAAWDVALAGFAEWTTWLDGATLATGFSRVSSLRAFCFHEPAVFARGFCQVLPLLLVWGMLSSIAPGALVCSREYQYLPELRLAFSGWF